MEDLAEDLVLMSCICFRSTNCRALSTYVRRGHVQQLCRCAFGGWASNRDADGSCRLGDKPLLLGDEHPFVSCFYICFDFHNRVPGSSSSCIVWTSFNVMGIHGVYIYILNTYPTPWLTFGILKQPQSIWFCGWATHRLRVSQTMGDLGFPADWPTSHWWGCPLRHLAAHLPSRLTKKPPSDVEGPDTTETSGDGENARRCFAALQRLEECDECVTVLRLF